MTFLSLTGALLLFLSPLFLTILLYHLIDKGSKCPVSLASPEPTESTEPTEHPEHPEEPEELEEPTKTSEADTSKDNMDYLNIDWSKHSTAEEDEKIRKHNAEVAKQTEYAQKQSRSQEKEDEADHEIEEILQNLTVDPEGTTGPDNHLTETQNLKNPSKASDTLDEEPSAIQNTNETEKVFQESGKESAEDAKRKRIKEKIEAVNKEKKRVGKIVAASGVPEDIDHWIKSLQEHPDNPFNKSCNPQAPGANIKGLHQRRPVEWSDEEDTNLIMAAYLQTTRPFQPQPIANFLGKEKFSAADVEKRYYYLMKNHKASVTDRVARSLWKMHKEQKAAK